MLGVRQNSFLSENDVSEEMNSAKNLGANVKKKMDDMREKMWMD